MQNLLKATIQGVNRKLEVNGHVRDVKVADHATLIYLQGLLLLHSKFLL